MGCILGELIDGEPMFPGDDALDQLVKIYQLAGPLDRKLLRQMESMFGANAYRLLGGKHKMNRQEICRKKLRARYKKKIGEKALDLLAKLLDNNPDTRPTAKEALEHEWFSDLLGKDPQLRRIKKKAENVDVGKIIGELCLNAENKTPNLPRENDKKEKIFRFSDMEKKPKVRVNRKEKMVFQQKEIKKPSNFIEKSGLKKFYGGNKFYNYNKENLENKSRALIQEKIKQKNFSVTKNKQVKSKPGLKMGFSMIPKIGDNSGRFRDSKMGIKSFINTAMGREKRRGPGISMGKSKNKKPFLKKKIKNDSIKIKSLSKYFFMYGV